MSTLHKFKAYFGMVPLEDYEDDYLEEPGRRPARPYGDDRQAGYRSYPEPAYKARRPESVSRRDEFDDDDDYIPPRTRESEGRGRVAAMSPRSTQAAGRAGMPAMHGATRGALAMDPVAEERRIEERRPALVDDGGPLSRITTLRPRDYSEARTIGERFRDGTPVIMDLVEMSNADAKRLVDFAAGLAFALRGSFDKVATKVFLLSPADVDVSAEERRRLAEKGFYS